LCGGFLSSCRSAACNWIYILYSILVWLFIRYFIRYIKPNYSLKKIVLMCLIYKICQPMGLMVLQCFTWLVPLVSFDYYFFYINVLYSRSLRTCRWRPLKHWMHIPITKHIIIYIIEIIHLSKKVIIIHTCREFGGLIFHEFSFLHNQPKTQPQFVQQPQMSLLCIIPW